ncbi:hypothetical protein [Pelagibacterium halotolerans]|uniref:hypothetical protein n=1 Tax=Pelagibacterium halotolerans TaxID=531813 RepID=UPI00059EE914|nr:hypothetical protein [Pelagibacterium halotolerans]QJR17250.1 hypothetical protein HKM20_01510 [Pelagibacterium halotolerans]SEA99755.1 hypothetical protein SAMN05428936_1232 [Pelagibacterium halotolerans]
MPVLGVFALAAYTSYRYGVVSCLAIGVTLFFWALMALLMGVPFLAIGCVIAAGNMGWLTGLWLQSEAQAEIAR